MPVGEAGTGAGLVVRDRETSDETWIIKVVMAKPKLLINWSTNQPINRSENQTINWSLDPWTNLCRVGWGRTGLQSRGHIAPGCCCCCCCYYFHCCCYCCFCCHFGCSCCCCWHCYCYVNCLSSGCLEIGLLISLGSHVWENPHPSCCSNWWQSKMYLRPRERRVSVWRWTFRILWIIIINISPVKIIISPS